MEKIRSFFNDKLSGFFSTPKVCRTRMINDRFYECKVKKPNPKYCDHSLSSGDGFICKHDNRKGFAAK